MGDSWLAGARLAELPLAPERSDSASRGCKSHSRRGQSSRYRLKRNRESAEARLDLGSNPEKREDLTSESLWGLNILSRDDKETRFP
ncbi:hypothetical protein I79_015139 [Cricetulus griseus]|uniref:Uncharacterized protein n=1 Tax=Cricetulus griseus TaxID=10029 RepID=G3HVZ3_CRIGR|nr:hypothetical protein I79_015139 [Cricetulus griseus]ERE89122.1 hypothetical protein H671_1g2565 [Cricetulus griseus]